MKQKSNPMDVKLLTIVPIQLILVILFNINSVNLTISTPLQLNKQYYHQQNEQLRKAQLQRQYQKKLYQNPIDLNQQQKQQQLNFQPQAQQLIQGSIDQNEQSTTESIQKLIEKEKLREKQILLLQEKQRQQLDQLRQLGVHLYCDTHLCSSTVLFEGEKSDIGSGVGDDYGDTNNELNNNLDVNLNDRFRAGLSSGESTMVEDKQCSCNESCTKYGDCCLDSVSSKASLARKYLGGFKRDSPWRHWQCTTVRVITESIHILTIGGCSRFWPRKPGDSVQEKCEDVGSGLVEDDPFLSVPIYSLRTKQNYRNLYCAICNYDANYASTWETFTMCVKNDSQGRCSKSFVYFERPQGVDLHECYPTDYDSCPKGLSTMNEITIKCGLYYAPVKLASGLTAKNEWCAMCNNVTIVGSVCPETRPTFDRQPPVTSSPGRHFSLPVILDIDFTTGGLIVGTKERCPPNHIYDPWKRACRVVTCDRDAQLEGDRCVPNSDSNHPEGISMTFQACPKITFNPEEYVIYSNGTVYITSREKQIEPGHYRIDMATEKLSICAHSHVILVGKFSATHDYLSNIGTSISIISLCIKIVLFFCVSQPRRTANIVILFLCISLLLAQTLFQFGINLTSNPLICSIIGIGIHYLYLASFFWMNVLSYDIFCTFSMERLVPQGKISSSRQIISYSFYGWLSPLLVILTSTLVDQYARSSIFAPNYGHDICWVSNRLALLVFFAIPVAILLITNTVFFAFTATRINKISKIGKLARENVAIRRKTFIIYTKLFLIMGLTWIFGFIAAYAKNSFLWSLFIVFNSLQGFYILIAFTDIKWGNLRNLIKCPLQRVANSSSSIATATTISTEQ